MTDWLLTPNYAATTTKWEFHAETAAGIAAYLDDVSAFPLVAMNGLRGVFWGAEYRSPQEDPNREIITVSYPGKYGAWYYTRGQEGTTAQTWPVGSKFAVVLTDGVLGQIRDEVDARSLTSHNHALADLSERSYASLTDVPARMHTVHLTAGEAVLSSSPPTQTLVQGSAAARASFYQLEFGAAAASQAWWPVVAPSNYTGGKISVTLYWKSRSANSGDVALWSGVRRLQGTALINDTATATGIEGTIAFNPEGLPTNRVWELARVWNTSLPGADRMALLGIGRNAPDAFAEDVCLLGVKLEFPVSG